MLQLGLHIVICYVLLRFEQLLTNLLEKGESWAPWNCAWTITGLAKKLKTGIVLL